MTPKTLLNALLMVLGILAHVQVQANTGKLYIIEDSSRPALESATNPTAALAQTERVELTARNAIVSVQRCGALGCLDPVGQPVSAAAVRYVNESVGAVDLQKDGGGPCRVCVPAKAIATDLEDYVERIKTVAPEFER